MVNLPDAKKKPMRTGETPLPMNIRVTFRPTRTLGQLLRRVGQNRFALTSYGREKCYVKADVYRSPPAPQIHKFLVSEHLPNIWVADAASFRGGSVRSRVRSSGCISTSQRSTIFPSTYSKIFSTG